MTTGNGDNLELQVDALTATVRELSKRQQLLLSSRFLWLGWRLGFGKTPSWANESLADLLQQQGDKMAEALAHLVRKKFRPQVILDIGAAKGYWSQKAAGCWNKAEFFMVDPLVENEPHLQRICQERRFKYLLTAMGAVPGEHLMNVTADLEGSTLLDYFDGNNASRRTVPVETIDRLLTAGSLKPPQLVKIDVQGFELQVLDGGQKLFESAEVFIIETSLFRFMPDCPRVHDLISYMSQRGFLMFDIAGLLRRPFENDLGQMDIVFLRNDSPMIASNRWS
jgi:FkbM family methyltransferase